MTGAGRGGAGGTAGVMAGVTDVLNDSIGAAAGTKSSIAPFPLRETVMTPPHTAQRARTDSPGTFAGSTR